MTAAVLPRYGGGSLADLVPSLLTVLGAAGSADPLNLAADHRFADLDRIALLLVDGLGHELLPRIARYAPTVADLARVAGPPLTSGFPSTTPTSLVSLATGVPPGRHGVLGFTVLVPGTDRVLNHIRWSTDPDPRRWQPVPSLFDHASTGVSVTVVSRPEFAGSGLTVAAYGQTRYLGATGVDELAATMLATLAAADRPTLVYGYHPDLDQAGHQFGTGSEQWARAAADVERLVARLVGDLPPRAALVVTADHGQFDVPADGRFDVDADLSLRAGVRGVAGEPRVRYLYTQPGATDDVLATWRAVLGDAAWVGTRAEAVASGWFGPVSADFETRIGDVVIVCRDRHVVLASAHEPAMISRMIGFHGSLTPAEMLIPLLVARR
ncbi:MAG TPA: nucleotide pyrophosphatase/phosphodiesterase family protein [Micromonosporaceae bacterium]